MANRRKKVILGFFFVVLLLPLVQQSLPFIYSAPLFGIYNEAPDVVFTWKEWFSGDYQHNKNIYLKERMGFRADMVRLQKQINFSLFNNPHSSHIVAGTNGVLYQKAYIYTYYGDDFIGRDSIKEYVRQLKAIQDTFAAMGKTLILAHAPCKAYYYPNDFPHNMRRTKHTPSNYEVYTQYASAAHINQIDFNAWFVAMSDTSKELLYPKQGIHWSWYGALLASDSLAKYIENKRNIKMIHPHWETITHTTNAMYTDDDIAATLNLIFPVCTETFAYPNYKYLEDNTQTKPSMILVGDSFMWTLIDNYFVRQGTRKWEFWFYYRQRCNNQTGHDGIPLKAEDLISDIDSADCILVLYTAHNMHELGSGFIKNTYAHYFPAH